MKPVQVFGIDDAVQLSLGGTGFSCALRASGSIVCWGSNFLGQLGDGTTTQRNLPVGVMGIDNAALVSAGEFGTCAVDMDDVAWCWGRNYAGALGADHADPATCGTEPCALTPQHVGGAMHVVSAGLNAACAISSAGAPQCWGWNGVGQVGDGTTEDRALPTAVAGGPFSSIFSGYQHTCGVSRTGGLFCWGASDDTAGSITTPTAVPTLDRDIVQVSDNYWKLYALRKDGAVFTWGVTPVQVPGL